jgi:uncharacterized protein YndB with AHSA1/START domain
MERKTKVHAEEGKHDLTITREFELPVELLFKAYEDPEIVAQWMGAKVVKLESRKYGSYRFETSDANGNVMFIANGIIHDFVPNQKITRTFEMENAPFDVQLEFLEFEELSESTSKLTIHTIFRSGALRDQLLKMPFEYGINMAYCRLEEIVSQLK